MVVRVSHKEPYDVWMGRRADGSVAVNPEDTGYFGNVFSSNDPSSPYYKGSGKSDSIKKHKLWAVNRYNTDEVFKQAVNDLYGKRIACICDPSLPCHSDILIQLSLRHHLVTMESEQGS